MDRDPFEPVRRVLLGVRVYTALALSAIATILFMPLALVLVLWEKVKPQ